MSNAGAAAAVDRGAIASLVDAERQWHAQLDSARADAARVLAAAQAEAEHAEREADGELQRLVDARRQELEATAAHTAAQVEAEGRARTERLRGVSDDVVRRLAERIADTAPWVGTDAAERPS